jgi:hypothetical protein
MNTPNAFLFVGLGLFMELWHLSPAVTGVRETWLLVMGAVFVLIGTMFLTQTAWQWAKPRLITPMLVLLPRREDDRTREVPNGRRASI